MTGWRNIRPGVLAAFAVGVAGTVYIVLHVGAGAVFHAAEQAGWSGLGLLLLYGIADFGLLGTAWLLIAPPYTAGRALRFFWSRAVRDSAGDVLPFSQLGGMAIGARAAVVAGEAQAEAIGSTVVDVTLEAVAQVAFIVLGLALLIVQMKLFAWHLAVVKTATIALLAGAIAAAIVLFAQRRGLGPLEHAAERYLPQPLTRHLSALTDAIRQIHGEPHRLIAACLLHMAGWLFSAFGLWLALRLIYRPLGFSDAIVIESLMCALRSAAVFVPAAIGVQEAGYAVMLPLFGLPPDIGIAVSLLKRAREIALAVPVLVSWQLAEGGYGLKPARQD